MQRIDGLSVAAALPIETVIDPLTPGGTPGYFQKGDPSVGQAPTSFKSWWLNMIQEEIVADHPSWLGAVQGILDAILPGAPTPVRW